MTPQIGTCNLCLQTTKLCKSHIIPDLAYKSVTDHHSHPRMVVARNANSGLVIDKNRQTGFWDYMLCAACEEQFSKYETYAENMFLSTSYSPPGNRETVIQRAGLDYKQFKLFLLSMLWRIGVAKNDFFRCVNLGPHESKLREMLIRENPGDSDEYGCLIRPLLPEKAIDMTHVLFQPFRMRVDGHNVCFVCFRGFVFTYYISRHAIPRELKQLFLNGKGEIGLVWSRFSQIKPLCDLWTRVAEAIQRGKRSNPVG